MWGSFRGRRRCGYQTRRAGAILSSEIDVLDDGQPWDLRCCVDPGRSNAPAQAGDSRGAGTKPGARHSFNHGNMARLGSASPSVQAPVKQMNAYWKLWTDVWSV